MTQTQREDSCLLGVKNRLIYRLLLCLMLAVTIGCASVVETQEPQKEPAVSTIVIQDGPLLLDSAIQFRVVPANAPSGSYTCLWNIDNATSIFKVQNADTISLKFHDAGLHNVTVQVLDSTSTSVAFLHRSVLISMAPISITKLASFSTVLLRFKGALIRKSYESSSDNTPDYSIDTTGLELQAPILLIDGVLYYAGYSSASSSNGTHSGTSGNSTKEMRFKLEDNGRTLSQCKAGYYESHDERGYPVETGEHTELITINQVPFVQFRHDTLEYRLLGKALKEAVFTIYSYEMLSRQEVYGSNYYYRHIWDSIDWDNASHPPQLSILLF